METLHKITGKVRLEMAEQVVRFMDEIKAYEMFVTGQRLDSELDPVVDGRTFVIHRPFIDERYPIKDIREFAWAIGLDVDLHAVYIDLLSIGDVTRTLVSPWMAFRGTNHFAASAIILVHNHPSGDPSPSEADIELTRAIVEGGIKLPKPLLDHIILGDGCHYGMAEEGLMSRLDQEVREDIKEKRELRKIINEKDRRIAELEARLKGFESQ